MILDAKDHKFDLIITKEVSRFARDLEDSIHYIRELKSSGVGIYFENQNLNTFDEGSELILNIMFNIAQEESRKLSKRIKFGHHEAIKKGHVLGSSNIIGYQKDNCKLVIIKNMLKLYQNINETNKYDLEVKEIDKDIKTIEDKKSMTLDLVFSGKLKKEELKVQFNNFESTLKALNIKRKKS